MVTGGSAAHASFIIKLRPEAQPSEAARAKPDTERCRGAHVICLYFGIRHS